MYARNTVLVRTVGSSNNSQSYFLRKIAFAQCCGSIFYKRKYPHIIIFLSVCFYPDLPRTYSKSSILDDTLAAKDVNAEHIDSILCHLRQGPLP